MKGNRIRHIPREYIAFSGGMPAGYSGLRPAWPLILAALIAGVASELAKAAILETRRNIYNRNRNRKYIEGGRAEERKGRKERERKNQRWRTTRRNANTAVRRPLPPGFTEELRRQWDKVHDSLDETLKFGKMLVELEDYVDNSFRYNRNGDIVGRNPGMKGFLALHCPHIGYGTAIRYRMLALKAREVEIKGKLEEVQAKATSIDDLWDRLDSCLSGVEDRTVDYRRRMKHRCRDRDIFALRDQVRSAVRNKGLSKRERYLFALKELIREFSVS